MATKEKIRFSGLNPNNLGVGEVRLKDPNRTGTITVREYMDLSGALIELKNSKGVPRVVKINRNKKYNLNNIDEKLEFDHIINHPVYVNCPDPILECVNLEEKAEEVVTNKMLFADAIVIVRGLKGNDLRDFARILLFGRRVTFDDRTSDNVLLEHIFEIAETNPERIIEEWNSPEKEIKILIRRGLDKGIFKYVNNVYKLKDNIVGTTFEQAIDYLKQNDDLIPSIRKEINE
jgi:hypothetical protein